MSDGYDGGDYGHIEHGQEQYDLDHGHAEQAYNQDHDLNYNAYGQEHNYENDQHYNHGEAEHYHSPDGGDYSKVEYTNYDSHVEDHSAEYGEQYTAQQHDASFSELDYLQKHFDAEFLHADFASYGEHGYEGGQQELSAANK